MRTIIATLALLMFAAPTHAAKVTYVNFLGSPSSNPWVTYSRWISDWDDLTYKEPTFFEFSTIAVGTNDLSAVTGARIAVRGPSRLASNLFDTSIDTTIESSGEFEVYYVSDLQVSTFDPAKRTIYIAADSYLRLNKDNGDSVTWFGDGSWEYIESGELYRKEPRTLNYREILGKDFGDYLGRTPEPSTLAMLTIGLICVGRRKTVRQFAP